MLVRDAPFRRALRGARELLPQHRRGGVVARAAQLRRDVRQEPVQESFRYLLVHLRGVERVTFSSFNGVVDGGAPGDVSRTRFPHARDGVGVDGGFENGRFYLAQRRDVERDAPFDVRGVRLDLRDGRARARDDVGVRGRSKIARAARVRRKRRLRRRKADLIGAAQAPLAAHGHLARLNFSQRVQRFVPVHRVQRVRAFFGRERRVRRRRCVSFVGLFTLRRRVQQTQVRHDLI